MSGSRTWRGEPWPAADALFRSDPRWLGSDDAYSVPLSPDRTLWLFGDTFIGDGHDPDRRHARFVRNSVGVMTGTDPSTATIEFTWGPTAGAPFFEVPEPAWLWPLDGARVGERLLVFHMLVRPAHPGGTGGIEDWRAHGPLGFFEVFGWTATLIENPDDAPEQWRWSIVAPILDAEIVLGAAVVIEGAHVVLYGWDRDKRVFAARLGVEDAAAARFEGLAWWCGDGWRIDGTPVPVIEDGSTEFTVHRIDADTLALTAVVGLSDAALAIRTAAEPQGPWSEPERVFEPEEAMRAGVFAYAGKAHPQLAGADLVATYASISDADMTLGDDALYRPRFIRLTREAGH